MIAEILNEIGMEVAHAPARLIAETAQFLIIVGLIWVVAIGFGKRRGFVANMLSERRETVRAQLEEAQGADARLESAEQAAREREVAASREAERLLSEARASASQSEQQTRADADSEAARILQRATTALEDERLQMQADLREQLVELVSQASRTIMNEKLTVAEQRTQIEEAIAAGVATASQTADPPKRARGAATVHRSAVVASEGDR